MNQRKLRLTCLKMSKEILESADSHGRGINSDDVIADAEKLLNWIHGVAETVYGPVQEKTDAELLAIIRGKTLYMVKG